MAERPCSSAPDPVKHQRQQPHPRPQPPPPNHQFNSFPQLRPVPSNYEDQFSKTFMQNLFAHITFIIAFIGVGGNLINAEIQKKHILALYAFSVIIHSVFARVLVSSFEEELVLTDIMKMKIQISLAFCIAISTSALFYGSVETGIMGLFIWALSFNVLRKLCYLSMVKPVIEAFLYMVTVILGTICMIFRIILMIVSIPYHVVVGFINIYQILTEDNIVEEEKDENEPLLNKDDELKYMY